MRPACTLFFSFRARNHKAGQLLTTPSFWKPAGVPTYNTSSTT